MTIERGIEASMTEVILGIVKAPAYATTIKDFCAEYQIDMGKLTAHKLFSMSSPSEASPNIGDLLYRRSEIYGGRGFAERPHRPLVLLEQKASPDQKCRKVDILDYYFETIKPYFQLKSNILTPRNLYTYQRES